MPLVDASSPDLIDGLDPSDLPAEWTYHGWTIAAVRAGVAPDDETPDGPSIDVVANRIAQLEAAR